eukprot:8237965-Pyramimonas_sp.AAC.1
MCRFQRSWYTWCLSLARGEGTGPTSHTGQPPIFQADFQPLEGPPFRYPSSPECHPSDARSSQEGSRSR